MTWRKRLLDLALAILLAIPLAPLALGIVLAVWIVDGRPILHRSRRMRAPGKAFLLLKFRTLRPDASATERVCGGDMRGRITRTGRILRRARLDELPQLWNVLRGEMSFVGPRPPLPDYVDRFPDLYARVLAARPGITGLATLWFHAHEDRLLAACRSAAETDAVYVRRCLPRKARLDLIYLRRRSIRLDLALMAATARALWLRPLRHGRGHARGLPAAFWRGVRALGATALSLMTAGGPRHQTDP